MRIFKHNRQKLIIAGLGPGSPELVTLDVFERAANSQVILIPRSHENEKGLAETIMAHHMPDRILTPLLFPMIRDSEKRDKIIFSQLKDLMPEIENAENIFFPVIGDSMLYSTGDYLIEAMKKLIPDIDFEFIPGISAHSLASACAKRFMAMSDEIFSVIPGTADTEKISAVLKISDTAAIYKPTAINDIQKIITETGPYTKIIRVDFAGVKDKEKIFEGKEAINDIKEYLSIILLWH